MACRPCRIKAINRDPARAVSYREPYPPTFTSSGSYDCISSSPSRRAAYIVSLFGLDSYCLSILMLLVFLDTLFDCGNPWAKLLECSP